MFRFIFTMLCLIVNVCVCHAINKALLTYFYIKDQITMFALS